MRAPRIQPRTGPHASFENFLVRIRRARSYKQVNVHWNHELPPDLAEVERRLRESRPEPTDAELARIRLAVEVEMAHMEAPARPRRSSKVLLRSRVAITSMFVTGFLMAGSGAGLAISGISSSGSAGVAQYPTTTTGTVTSSTPVNTQ